MHFRPYKAVNIHKKILPLTDMPRRTVGRMGDIGRNDSKLLARIMIGPVLNDQFPVPMIAIADLHIIMKMKHIPNAYAVLLLPAFSEQGKYIGVCRDLIVAVLHPLFLLCHVRPSISIWNISSHRCCAVRLHPKVPDARTLPVCAHRHMPDNFSPRP